MKIRMLSTAPGSADGIRVAAYEAGLEYDLTTTAGARDLAEVFVGAGLAEEVGASKGAADPGDVADDASEAVADASETTAAPKSGRKPKAQ
jgi:hypothetical protein